MQRILLSALPIKALPMLNNNLSQEVSFGEFKGNKCDENQLISGILSSVIGEYIIEPFLDVGSGLGDIPRNALKDLSGYLVDIEHVDEKLINTNHTWVVSDFFELSKDDFPRIKTILFCHSLQYLDENIEKLKCKLVEFSPLHIIDVVNINAGNFEKACVIIESELESINKEVAINDYVPNNYSLVLKVPFTAKLSCETFEELVHILAYFILDSKNPVKNLPATIRKLKSLLVKPELEIQQNVRFYSQNLD